MNRGKRVAASLVVAAVLIGAVMAVGWAASLMYSIWLNDHFAVLKGAAIGVAAAFGFKALVWLIQWAIDVMRSNRF